MHIIDLRTRKIHQRITSPNTVTDIVAPQKDIQEKTVVVVEKNEKSKAKFLTAFTAMGLTVVFMINVMATLGKTTRLLTTVSHSAEQGYKGLLSGSEKIKQGNILSAENIFEKAIQDFNVASESVWFLKNDQQFSGAAGALEGGQDLAKAAIILTDIAAKKMNMNDPNIGEKIEEIAPMLDELNEKIQSAARHFHDVDPNIIPQKFREKFATGLALLQSVAQKAQLAKNLLPGILAIIDAGGNGSDDTEKKSNILLVLQNSDEIRPTGGFIGSYMNIQFDHAKLAKTDLHDVYSLDDPFRKTQMSPIEPPAEIKKLSNAWFFRDANYSPDFAVSGEKLLWFYEKESLFHEKAADRPETVIAIDHNLLGRLLEVTGPIDVPGLKAGVTASNYRQILTYVIESKFTGLEDPKKILKDFAPIFITRLQERLSDKESARKVAKILLEEITEKNILGYSRNHEIQKLFQEIGMDGMMKKTGENEDYLNIVQSSFSGNKSDAYMKQNVTHETAFDLSGVVVDQLTIERQHTWNQDTFRSWKEVARQFGYDSFPPHIMNIIGQGDNKVALRIYVPDGSVLQSAEGIDINKVATLVDSDNGRTYFSLDFITPSGQEKAISLTYILPFTLDPSPLAPYRLQVQKQAGVAPWTLKKIIHPGESYKLYDALPQSLIQGKTADGKVKIKTEISKDVSLATLWGGR